MTRLRRVRVSMTARLSRGVGSPLNSVRRCSTVSESTSFTVNMRTRVVNGDDDDDDGDDDDDDDNDDDDEDGNGNDDDGGDDDDGEDGGGGDDGDVEDEDGVYLSPPPSAAAVVVVEVVVSMTRSPAITIKWSQAPSVVYSTYEEGGGGRSNKRTNEQTNKNRIWMEI